MFELEHSKAVDLDRGLFIVIYKTAENITAPPRVVLSADGNERNLEFLLHPDASEPTMWQPNSAVVVRVSSPASLHVQVLPSRTGGSRAVTVGIERIHSGQLAGFASATNPHVSPRSALNTKTIKLLGHVAGRGDVVVGTNEWIAGPTAPSRIEGLALEWSDKPVDIAIRYGVRFANAPDSGKMVSLGTFAGTRGRALPITSVVLELIGNSDVQFAAEAIFLSAPTLRSTGQRLILSGPTGSEPLVGLKVAVERIVGLGRSEDFETSHQSSGSGRVRVFRSRPLPESAIT